MSNGHVHSTAYPGTICPWISTEAGLILRGIIADARPRLSNEDQRELKLADLAIAAALNGSDRGGVAGASV